MRWWILAAVFALGCAPGSSAEEEPTPAGDASPPGADGWVPAEDPPEDEPPPFEPAPATLYRLTATQYRNCVRDLLGDVEVPADLEPDTPLHGFNSIGAAELTISPRAAEQFEAAAFAVAAQAFADGAAREALVGCDPAEDGCARGFILRFGRRAWRRPLEGPEVEALVGLRDDLRGTLGDPVRALEFTVAAMLQSPWFLFRVERGAEDGWYPAYELASRLSFLLWNTAPDPALLDAAAAGRLGTAEGVHAEATRLLADPRAEAATRGFFAEYFLLDRLDTLAKDPELFPQMSPTLGAAMRAEIEGMIARIVFEEDADIRSLLTTRDTVIDAELAALYGLPPVEGPGPQPVRLPEESPRGGLLGTAGVLALNAHHTVTSPTLRGKFIQNTLLCFDIPPPPPGVAATLDEVEADGPITTREKLTRHRTDPACNGCHQHMDPLGLGLENFDAIGAFRTTEDGLPIDARAELFGETFAGPRALGALLRDHPDIGACVARRFWRHAMGHLEAETEEAAVRALAAAFADADHRVQGLLLAFVASDAFRRVGPTPVAPEDGEGD